jgi:prefoldin subunit 5
MKPNDEKPSDKETEALQAQFADLRKEVDELELHKAILERTIELLEKARDRPEPADEPGEDSVD